MDEIFLISEERFLKYRDAIPKINRSWWLSYPGAPFSEVTYVTKSGKTTLRANVVAKIGIRPGLFLNDSDAALFQPGDVFIKYNYPWIFLGGNAAIAEVPIDFGKFDQYSNNYKESHVREKLLSWLEERGDSLFNVEKSFDADNSPSRDTEEHFEM